MGKKNNFTLPRSAPPPSQRSSTSERSTWPMTAPSGERESVGYIQHDCPLIVLPKGPISVFTMTESTEKTGMCGHLTSAKRKQTKCGWLTRANMTQRDWEKVHNPENFSPRRSC